MDHRAAAREGTTEAELREQGYTQGEDGQWHQGWTPEQFRSQGFVQGSDGTWSKTAAPPTQQKKDDLTNQGFVYDQQRGLYVKQWHGSLDDAGQGATTAARANAVSDFSVLDYADDKALQPQGQVAQASMERMEEGYGISGRMSHGPDPVGVKAEGSADPYLGYADEYTTGAPIAPDKQGPAVDVTPGMLDDGQGIYSEGDYRSSYELGGVAFTTENPEPPISSAEPEAAAPVKEGPAVDATPRPARCGAGVSTLKATIAPVMSSAP